MSAKTRWYWKDYVDGWFLWGVWIRSQWFIGVARTFHKPKESK